MLAVLLAGCGSDEPGTATVTPGATTAAPSSETSSSAPASSSAAGSSTASTTAASSSAAPSSAPAAGADPGPAAEGAVIAAGAVAALPAAVGEWTVADGGGGPATIYDKGDLSNTVSFLSGSDYAGISTSVAEQVTPAGTGVCGLTSGGFSRVCYLAAADGVFSLTGDDDLSVPDLATFANQLTAELGTS